MTKPELAEDGFVWIRGITSNHDAWTLQDPNGANVAHVVPERDTDRRLCWLAVTDRGDTLTTAGTCREALAAVDNECRPCAAATQSGVIQCDNDRKLGSRYCPDHQRFMATTPDPDRPHLWMCGCLVNDSGAHRVGCPSHIAGREGIR